MGAEPGTLTLLDRAARAGCASCRPALLPDNDLDWGEYAGEDSSRSCGTAGGWPCPSPPAGAWGRRR
ncbi:hypothetical protein LV779_16780 [Streptomyces thinghirensis]|nr:hypothetical protein [Streptomyces thinghirensis]